MKLSLDEKTAKLDPKTYHTLCERTTAFRDALQQAKTDPKYALHEGFARIPFDASIEKEVHELVRALCTPRLKYIFVIGIGGSNLGTKAIYDALKGHFDIYHPDRFPKIIFLDTIDPKHGDEIASFVESIAHPEEYLVHLISKSGTTTESIANFEFLFSHLIKVLPSARERVVITAAKNSPLWTAAEEKDIARLSIPETLGGRFSVFSPVGLFPLAAAGIDITALLEGARAATELCLSDAEDCPATLSAAALATYIEQGLPLYISFFFNPALESLGKWYQQLVAESVGKEHDLNHNTVRTGIMPLVAIGSNDLHSVAQLLFGGPQNTCTQFVYANTTDSATVPQDTFFGDIDPQIKGRSFKEIIEAILNGVQTAYNEHDLPYFQIELETISPHTLGMFMQYKMIEIYYLGKLLDIDPFDQPNVESYKVATRKNLSK
jgi:glucose-6-phosphate isomerase